MGRIFGQRTTDAAAAVAAAADTENNKFSRTVSTASTLAVGDAGAHDNPAFEQCQEAGHNGGERIKTNAETTYL